MGEILLKRPQVTDTNFERFLLVIGNFMLLRGGEVRARIRVLSWPLLTPAIGTG